MAHTARPPQPERRANLLLAIVLAGVCILAAVEVWISTSSQDRLATVRESQVSGQERGVAQRTDQTQLTCALWAAMRSEPEAKEVPASVRAAADAICTDVPTPAPKP
ncbi:hypothetical protein AB0I84_35180 [Streptomyces spectabilis]|uniref:hypothetical protein n=1 Tax=Streptomyces spectabilis TaxID=68270 RepID=UPI0033D3D3CC